MSGTGISYGAISVLNAIPCGIGATIGVDLKTIAEFSPFERKFVELVGRPGMNTSLAETCVRRTFEYLGEKPFDYKLRITSNIPPSRGLKSSSSVCNAVISAVLDHFGAKMDKLDLIRLGVECAKEAGVTITGAFDDACGCHLGGLVITDNTKNELLERREVPKYDVVIISPDRQIPKNKVNLARYRELKDQFEELAHSIDDDYLKVLTENGKHVASLIGMDYSVCREAFSLGALAAGVTGTGPAVAIVCEPEKTELIATSFPNTIICGVRS